MPHHGRHGEIAVSAVLDPVLGMVMVHTTAAVAGLVGLRVVDESTGCPLNQSTIKLLVEEHSLGPAASSSFSGDISGKLGPLTLVTDVHRRSLDNTILHPTFRDQHIFIPLPTRGRHTVTAAYNTECITGMQGAANVAADVRQKVTAKRSNSAHSSSISSSKAAMVRSSHEAGLPTIPPFSKPAYPASWTIDTDTGGDWMGAVLELLAAIS
jgi:hypothetical protein